MSIDLMSVYAILDIVAKGIGVAKELQELAKRIKAGEKITKAEIEDCLKKNKEALDRWKAIDDAQKK